jgi:hypothetical protein
MEAVKYVLKKIETNVPLYDPDKKTYLIVVEGELVDIPEEIFHRLFKEEEIKPVEFLNNKINPFSKFESKTSKEIIQEYASELKNDSSVKALINFLKSNNKTVFEVKEMFYRWLKEDKKIDEAEELLGELKAISDEMIEELFK